MIDKLKYIMFKDGNDETYPVIFGSNLKHNDMALMNLDTVVSAGFIDKEWKCFGESYSLNVKSNEKDSNIIKKHFRTGAYS